MRVRVRAFGSQAPDPGGWLFDAAKQRRASRAAHLRHRARPGESSGGTDKS